MTFPFPKRPQIEVMFATNFSEYTVGVQPFDWTKETNVASWTTLTVENVAGSLSGKAMQANTQNTNDKALVWNRVPVCGEVEILMRSHKMSGPVDNASLGGSMARLQLPTAADASTLTLATSMVLEQHEDYLGKWVNGTQSTVAQYTGAAVGGGAGNWWWQRTRFVGNSIETKHWVFGTAEPAYQPINDLGAGIPATGYVGWFTNHRPDFWVDYFAVSIGGIGVPPPVIPLPA